MKFLLSIMIYFSSEDLAKGHTHRILKILAQNILFKRCCSCTWLLLEFALCLRLAQNCWSESVTLSCSAPHARDTPVSHVSRELFLGQDSLSSLIFTYFC